jgi:carbon-monoxide dehydrogenase medium subunit
MTPFELATPRSLREAIDLLDPQDPGVRPVGGATALMLMMKAGVLQPRRLVSLRAVERRYSRIEIGPDGHLYIGALAPLAEIERSPLVRSDWPVLSRTLLTLSNVRVRNVATIGGHLAHADPHLDLPPLLSALGAQVSIVGRSSERTIPVAQLATGYYQTVLRNDELIAEVIVPPQRGRAAAYLKCTTRSADDWPALGVAVVLKTEDSFVHEASVVVGAATDVPTRLRAAESVLSGAKIEDAILRKAGEAAADELAVVGDSHGSAAYKKHLLRVYLGRAARCALDASRTGTLG